MVITANSPKENNIASEDAIGYNNNFYWLLDGATPPNEGNNHDLTHEYVNTLSACLSYFSISSNTVEDLLRLSTNETKRIFEQKYDLDNLPYLPYSTVVLVHVGTQLNYLILGDSTLYLETGDKSYELSDCRLKKVATVEREYVHRLRMLNVPENSTEYIEARKRLILEEFKMQNVNGGYWVSTFDSDAVNHAITGKIALNGNTSILLASDGFLRILNNCDYYSSMNELVTKIKSKGSTHIISKLRDLEESPSKLKKSTSSKHDDASFILVTT